MLKQYLAKDLVGMIDHFITGDIPAREPEPDVASTRIIAVGTGHAVMTQERQISDQLSGRKAIFQLSDFQPRRRIPGRQQCSLVIPLRLGGQS